MSDRIFLGAMDLLVAIACTGAAGIGFVDGQWGWFAVNVTLAVLAALCFVAVCRRWGRRSTFGLSGIIRPGDYIRCPDGSMARVARVTSDTTLTLDDESAPATGGTPATKGP